MGRQDRGENARLSRVRLAKGEELSDPAEYFLGDCRSDADPDGEKGNAVHEIPVQIKLDEMTFGDVQNGSLVLRLCEIRV